MSSLVFHATHRVPAMLHRAAIRFAQIDGMLRAEAFAFNAFFSLFPLTVLLVTVASLFVDRADAGKEVVAYLEGYFPITGEMQRYIFDTIGGVISARGRASVIALLVLLWAALQCFTTLTTAVNRAWNNEGFSWWRLPLNSLGLLGITAAAVLLGMAAPVLVKAAMARYFPAQDLLSPVSALGSYVVPLAVVFLTVSLFFKLAPRRTVRFADVWTAALFATILLHAAGRLFLIYLRNFASFNAVYGAFGGITALLLWIYLSGGIFIYGACLCAAQAGTAKESGK